MTIRIPYDDKVNKSDELSPIHLRSADSVTSYLMTFGEKDIIIGFLNYFLW